MNEIEAAKLYRALLLDTLELAKGLDSVHKILAFTPEAAEGKIKKIVGSGYDLRPQKGNDLGEKLRNLFLDLLGAYNKVVALSSDSPTLPLELLNEAFAKLDSYEAVIGPCLDGGYYLIGTRTSKIEELFKDIDWSTEVVLRQTLERAQNIGFSIYRLQIWYDIDTWADVEQLMREIKSSKASSPFFARWTRKFLDHYLAN